MNCLKCGVRIDTKESFCSDCLETMALYPVRPDAVAHIPHRKTVVHEKRAAPRAVDQLARLRVLIRWLVGIITALAILLCLTAGVLIHILHENAASNKIGTNYTADPGSWH